MEELLHAFGIDWRLIAIQIFNFALLAGILWYFLYEPVLKLLDERREKVRKGLEDAEEAAKARASAEDEKRAVLSEAQKEAGSIVARAREVGDEKKKSIMTEAEAEASRLVARAMSEGEELKRQLEKESEAEVAKAAILAAEKILQTK
jgi:F-type H+-transporting ATPase subunit b